MTIRTFATVCVVALGAMLATRAARAAEAQHEAARQTLEEVVVTAQKREQAAIDVPASVAALSAESLATSGMTRLEDYVAEVPGMSITALSRGYTSVVLRGISTGISQATPSTAYYIDEAPIGSVTAYAVGSTLTPDIDPYDLRRIEVLKGPQGTLYGAGPIGGLLRYVTAPPTIGKLEGAVTLGGNSVDHGGNGFDARLSVNLPLSDTMAMRASGFHRTDAGYIDNPVNGRKDVNRAQTDGGRIAWLWNLSDNWSLDAWYLTQQFSTGGIGAEDLTAPALTPVTRELARSSYIAETQHIKLDVANATLKGRIGEASIVSSTTYQTVTAETNVDQTPLFGFLFSLPPAFGGVGLPGIGAQTKQLVDTRRWSEELRVRASALHDVLEYEGGLFFTKEDSTNRLPPMDPFLTATLTPFPIGLPIANALIGIDYQEYSLFGNATYNFTSQFEMTAGLRFSHNKQDYVQDYKLALLSPHPVLINQGVEQNKVTYLLNARYKPTKDLAIYGRIATGYRPGGPSALPPGVVAGGKQAFDPDSLTSYEIGVKSEFMDGRASIEAAVFTTDWKNIQIQTSSTTASGTYQYFVNGGAARSQGAEATLTVLPVTGLTLRLNAAFTDSKLTEDAPAAGGLNGDRMPFVPRWTGSLGADYHFHVAGNWQPFVGASLNYIGDRISNFSKKNSFAPFDVSSYTTFNLNAGLELDALRVSVYGKNLNDSRGINFLNNTGLPFPGLNPYGNPFTAGVIEPRTIGLDLSYRF